MQTKYEIIERDDVIGKIISVLSKEEIKRYVKKASNTHGGMLCFEFAKFCTENINLLQIIQAAKVKRKKQNLYLLECESFYKIGISHDVPTRVKNINRSIPFKINIIGFVKVDTAAAAEKYWHKYYKKYRVNGEWFNMPQDALPPLTMFMQAEGGYVEIEKIFPEKSTDPKDDLPEKIISNVKNINKDINTSLLKRLRLFNTSLIKMGWGYKQRQAELIKCHERELILLGAA